LIPQEVGSVARNERVQKFGRGTKEGKCFTAEAAEEPQRQRRQRKDAHHRGHREHGGRKAEDKLT